jgi:hypothetical protein
MRGLPAYGVARRSNSLGVLRKRDTGGSSSSPLLTDLVAYWKLDDLTWSDSVGSNDLTGNTAPTVGTPKLGAGSAEFNGTSNRLAIPVGVFSSYPCSVSFWVRVGNTSGFRVWLTSTDTISIGIVSDGGSNLRFLYDSSNSYNLPSLAILGINSITWTHIAATFRASGVTTWIDGVEVSGTTSTAGGLGGSFIGGRNSGNYFAGDKDEFGCWDREFTDTDALSLYNSGSGLSYPFS